MNSLLDEHKAVHAHPGDAVSSRSEPANPFSLDGLPEGSADDLMSFAEQFGGLKRVG